MVEINEYLNIYIKTMFAITSLGCLVQLFSYGIFKALHLVNINR